MDLNTSTIMMIFFVGLLFISIWKIYAFLPNEQLSDDDNTPQAKEELLKIILKVIQHNQPQITLNELYEKVKNDEDFDAKHFWRFNPNKLHHLLEYYFAKHPDTKSIEELHKKLNT
ncbi:MAG: hypothetical protein IE887_03785 [Campylobacterales bacterium]|nr:hypothetical protein [Campylobacterales bacterium]